MRRSALIFALVLAALSAACGKSRSAELVAGAKFGVFFGGQIEERRDIPFELDRTRQAQGFRIDFGEPLTRDVSVEYRVDRPSPPAAGKRHGSGGIREEGSHVEQGILVARVGESRIERVMPFHPGDPLGLWNVRVVVDGKVVIDRPFEVYDSAARQRAGGPDAG